jgi:hypothetical protein
VFSAAKYQTKIVNVISMKDFISQFLESLLQLSFALNSSSKVKVSVPLKRAWSELSD